MNRDTGGLTDSALMHFLANCRNKYPVSRVSYHFKVCASSKLCLEYKVSSRDSNADPDP